MANSHITLSITNKAYDYLQELPPHIYRLHNRSVYVPYMHSVIATNIPRTAKGLSKFLEQLLCAKWRPVNDDPNTRRTYPKNWPQSVMSPVHTKYYKQPDLNKPIYQIKPETFRDARTDDMKQLAYELGFVPGQELTNFMLSKYGTWSPWGLVDEIAIQRRLVFTYSDEVLQALWDIAMYWHIGTVNNRRPTNKVMAASGVVEAIGNKVLKHDLLEML